MRRFLIHWKSLVGILMIPVLLISFLVGTAIQHNIASTHAANDEPSTGYQNYVTSMAKQHKAPFFSQQLVTDTTMQASAKKQQQTPARKPVDGTPSNIKVNQDHNGWPKAGVSAAINPVNGKNLVVTTS